MSADCTDRPLQDLLPWHANGTLAPAEDARVRGHLAGCAHCRAELAQITRLAGALQAPAAEPAWQPSAPHWAQVLARVDAEPVPLRVRIAAWLQRRPRLAAAAAAVAALGALLVVPLQAPLYQTLSAGEPAAVAGQALLRVAFGDGIDDAAARALLQSPGVRGVQGPSALGLYTVQVDGAQAQALLARLRAHPQVSLAEPAAP